MRPDYDCQRKIQGYFSHECIFWRAGSNFEGQSDKDKRADFSKLGLTGYSGDKVISQRDIQRLVSFSTVEHEMQATLRQGVDRADSADKLPPIWP